VARREYWHLNPLVLAWKLARGARHTLGFYVALRGERY
jgi:hypothetical protein